MNGQRGEGGGGGAKHMDVYIYTLTYTHKQTCMHTRTESKGFWDLNDVTR